jgi:Antirestriction protein (ArdA)
MANEINSYSDIIDVREVIERFEELESDRAEFSDEIENACETLKDATVKVVENIDDEDASEGYKAMCQRDVKEAKEALETAEKSLAVWDEENGTEFKSLKDLLSDLCGNGGDEQWLGDWYPISLIRDSYFTDYAQELLEDCGDLPKGLPHYIEIDWEATARNIRSDYTSTEFDGVTYWYR